MKKILELLTAWGKSIGAGFIVVFCCVCIFLSFNDRFELRWNFLNTALSYTSFVENWFYDFRTEHLYKHDRKSPNFTALIIDDESVQKIGRWPWTRTKHAAMLNALAAYDVKVVGFDILYPEKESAAADQAMVEAIKNFQEKKKGKVVLAYLRIDDPSYALKEIPTELLFSVIDGGSQNYPLRDFPYVDKENFPIPEYTSAAPLFGFINEIPDRDGVFRHTKIMGEIEGTPLPSLGLAMFKAFYEDDFVKKLTFEPYGIDNYSLKYQRKDQAELGQAILNQNGEIKIRFFGGERNFETLNVAKLFAHPNGDNPEIRKLLAGKAVLIGSTTTGAHDLRHTPVDAQLPGMFLHANLFHMFDEARFFRVDDDALPVSMLLLAIGTILVLAAANFHNPYADLAALLVSTAGAFLLDRLYFIPRGYSLKLFFVMNNFIFIYVWFTFLNVLKEARERKKVRDAFTRYVAPSVVKQMLSSPDKLKVGGEKKEITMLFSDVRDFTSISERLTPTELSTLLNIYMGKMTDILFDTHGTLDKYIGDAMVGFWGAPVDVPENAYHAVRGASMMLESLPAINREFEKRKFPQINVGIGLNTGEVSVGNMGSDRIFAYTALGDHMNLASRLESLTKQYGANLMISEFTYEKMGEARRKEFKIRPLDNVQVKGKSQAVKIYEILPSFHFLANDDKLRLSFEDAYAKYLRKQFKEAKEIFEAIYHRYPQDKASARLQEACENFLHTPPPENWDGVTVFTSK